MLFNSYVFLLIFLPVCVLGFRAAMRQGGVQLSLSWLLACSLFFYGWWDPRYVLLLLASIGANFAAAQLLRRASGRPRKALLAAGIAGNLGLLGYFKYAGFFARTLAPVLGTDGSGWDLVLPLGISFFTFQQIAYLVDTSRGNTPARGLFPYALFITFFPHLIAGPITHHGELMPQLDARTRERARAADFSLGLAILVVGLVKKVILADSVARYASPTFAAAELGASPSFAEGWLAALAYTLQLYFDFSGYSDMAIGLALLFGVRLPANFDSPYKAVSIVDFWRRWHITLSRFLREYLYIPLGGNRRGPVRRYAYLMITMLLGGLWHGAGWTFVAWGGLHGAMLVTNHAWRALRHRLGVAAAAPGSWRLAAGRALTFVCVVAAWVLFRSHSWDGATRILGAMAGQNGFELADSFETSRALRLIAPLLLVVWLAPNTQQIFASGKPVLDPQPAPARLLLWRPTPLGASGLAIVAVLVLLGISSASEFLYYQF